MDAPKDRNQQDMPQSDGQRDAEMGESQNDEPRSMDPYDLVRFLAAQIEGYPTALREMSQGRKQTHWMWYIFPQFDGLGSSESSRYYAIKSRGEAQAYLKHSVLRGRLLACVQVLLRRQGRTARQILGRPDDLKLQSSMTLFAEVAEDPAPFETVLRAFFEERKDERTLELLAAADALLQKPPNK